MLKLIEIGEIDSSFPINYEVTTTVSIISPKSSERDLIKKVIDTSSKGSITIYSCFA
jgi:hypothetical protein